MRNSVEMTNNDCKYSTGYTEALMRGKYIALLKDVSLKDIATVGGKNASLGEMIHSLAAKGVRVPGGFAITTDAYRHYLAGSGLDVFIAETLVGLDFGDTKKLNACGKKIRNRMQTTPFPPNLEKEIIGAYRQMEKKYGRNVDVAVRSSATAEDLPDASFAGEHDTFLNVRGAAAVVKAARMAMASLYTDRAIAYRATHGFDHASVALAVGVQKMVGSDRGASGVMFTVDTESGFRNIVIINAIWGLGEMIVQGRVTPDEYMVRKSAVGKVREPIIAKIVGTNSRKMIYAAGGARTKIVSTTRTEENSFVLSDKEVEQLATWGIAIEAHYSKHAGKWTPVDIEWAKDGVTGDLYIVQARPETVQSQRDVSILKEYCVSNVGTELVRGISVGHQAVSGVARVITSRSHLASCKPGEILVMKMTDPDAEPVMKTACAIVTDRGGRTSHAAIIARELGIPAIVGTSDATARIMTGEKITIDATGSIGVVTRGSATIDIREHDAGALPETRTNIMVNIASPGIALQQSFLPVAGVGLAREEFIIASEIGVHPLAILNFKDQPASVRAAISERMRGWDDPVAYYVDNLAYGIARIAAAFAPRPVIVRFSDFKSNEYATLLGGSLYEPHEENPMLGWRGASRYYDPTFKGAFVLECQAMVRVREEMGLTNVIPMVPFCRTLEEADEVLALMAKYGLRAQSVKGKGKAVPVYMMCEIPSNAILADQFLDLFDGMSIGSNDLTQLTLGIDRDSQMLSKLGNENNGAVRELIRQVIATCRKRGKYVGICGQGPSDLPDFAEFLVREGIESISLNPDAVVSTIKRVAEIEKKMGKKHQAGERIARTKKTAPK